MLWVLGLGNRVRRRGLLFGGTRDGAQTFTEGFFTAADFFYSPKPRERGLL